MVRLYISHSLSPQAIVPLNEDQVHYVRNVLRHGVGDSLTVFNGSNGEWTAIIQTLTKSRGEVVVVNQARTPSPTPFVGLIFAPLKHDPLLYLIEKATELGVSFLQPVIMDRSCIHKFNTDKMQRNTIEASQQCERLEVPHVQNLLPLKEYLSTLDSQESVLIVCQERGQPQFISKAIETVQQEDGTTGMIRRLFFLIGPEGGLSPSELDYLGDLPNVHFCNLGPNILRAETAAVYALAAFQFSSYFRLTTTEIPR